jgi:hypothetical protein
MGDLDPEALRQCAALATTPLDEATVRRVLAEFPDIKVERKDGSIVLPWHGLRPVGMSEAFAPRLHELTGCLIAEEDQGTTVRGAFSEERSQTPTFARSRSVLRHPHLLARC